MKKCWKKILAAACAATLFMTSPGIVALADELQEEPTLSASYEEDQVQDVLSDESSDDHSVEEHEATESESEEPFGNAERSEGTAVGVVEQSEGSDTSDTQNADTYESLDEETLNDEGQDVGEGEVTVGDGVTATFNRETGEVVFDSDGGTLSREWQAKLGIEIKEIKSIRVKEPGVVCLPEDSSMLFYGFYYLTDMDLSGFDTSNVTNMGSMFRSCSGLTNLDLSGFDTSNVTDMSYMFFGCLNLTTLDLSSFNTSNVTYMGYMFRDCSSLTNLDLSSFDTSNVTNMDFMFYNCRSLTNLDLSSFDTSNVSAMGYMFYDCRGLTNLDLSSFDTSNVTNMSYMFYGCNSLTNLDLSSFNTSNVTYMGSMFRGCYSLTNLDLSSFDTSNVSAMGYMFYDCSGLTNLDLSSFDTSNVTTMGAMFSVCESLINLDLSGFDTSNVTDMSYIFSRCSSLTNLDLSSFDTSNVTSMVGMFIDCNSLTNLDLSSFDMSNVTDMRSMSLSTCGELTIVETPKRNNKQIYLPHTMYDSSGNSYSTLPIIEKSIVLGKTKEIAQAYENGDDSDKINAFTLTSGPIEVKVGGKAAVIAAYYDANGMLAEAPGGIIWGTSNGSATGKVNIQIVSDYYEYYLCEITGLAEGETIVTAETTDGRRASVAVHVTGAPEKESSENASATNHLSGSSNYNLETTKEGTFDVKDGITSQVTIDGRSKYEASDKIVIKNDGELSINGTLNAKEIVVKTGGYLDVDGRLNAETVTFEGGNLISSGGFLKGFGTICADTVIFKGSACTNFSGQIIAKNQFVYKSSDEPSEMTATLYVGGDLEVNDHFTDMQGKVRTVLYGDTGSHTFKVGKKSNLGTVYAADADSLHNTGIGSDNFVGAYRYAGIQKPDDGRWTFTATRTSLVNASEKSWANGLSAAYVDLFQNKQTAADVSSVLDSSLSLDERNMINQIAEAWIGTIHAQGPKGFLEIQEATFDLPFSLKGKNYFLRYELTSYGQYAEMGKISFGKDENNLSTVGLTSAASITAFKTQATAYLAESYVQEYYNFVTGSLPKGATDSWIKSKLKRGGINYVKKYMEKMLFQTLSVSQPESYKQLSKTLKLGKLMLKGDVEGLWKFAVEEVKSVVKNSSMALQDAGTAEAVGLSYAGTADLVGSPENTDSITDKYLKEALIGILGADSEGEPDFSKQADIKYLELEGRYIQSLEGIQKFTNLETLILANNELKDITALGSMNSLRYLDISGQEIQDLSPLSGLTGLVALNVSDNNVTSFQPLKGLPSLITLDVSNNPAASLEGIGSLYSLGILQASGLPLAGDMKELSGLANLREICMEGCGLTGLDGINTNSLKVLDVNGNEISALDPISTAAKLERLDISENALLQIPSLAGCSSLKEADLSGNMLIEIDGICEAPVLEVLNFSACELTNADMEILGGMPALKSLDISYNSIVDDISLILTVPTLEKVDVTRTGINTEDFDGAAEIIKNDPQGPAEDTRIEFTDVADPSAWYYNSVYWAVENNVTSGMGEGTFQPMAKLSRAQAVTFLYNLAGRPDVSGLQAKEFTDVSKTAWYYNAVKWAVANKITSGYGTGTFQPNATCNRAMIVTFLANYAKAAGTYKEPTTSASFKDVKAKDECDLQQGDDGYIFKEGGGAADGIRVIRSGRGVSPSRFVRNAFEAR